MQYKSFVFLKQATKQQNKLLGRNHADVVRCLLHPIITVKTQGTAGSWSGSISAGTAAVGDIVSLQWVSRGRPHPGT